MGRDVDVYYFRTDIYEVTEVDDTRDAYNHFIVRRKDGAVMKPDIDPVSSEITEIKLLGNSCYGFISMSEEKGKKYYFDKGRWKHAPRHVVDRPYPLNEKVDAHALYYRCKCPH